MSFWAAQSVTGIEDATETAQAAITAAREAAVADAAEAMDGAKEDALEAAAAAMEAAKEVKIAEIEEASTNAEQIAAAAVEIAETANSNAVQALEKATNAENVLFGMERTVEARNTTPRPTPPTSTS